MRRRLVVVGLALAAACCSKSEVKGGGSSGAGASEKAPKPTFTLFALAEVRGQIGPCGCTSDPLGDISRTVKLVDESRDKGPVLVVDAGSLLYSKNPIPPHLAAQEELKADLIARTYKDRMQVAAVGLGPADVATGPKNLRLPRHAANVARTMAVEMMSNPTTPIRWIRNSTHNSPTRAISGRAILWTKTILPLSSESWGRSKRIGCQLAIESRK